MIETQYLFQNLKVEFAGSRSAPKAEKINHIDLQYLHAGDNA
jgi:hypothetical protein